MPDEVIAKAWSSVQPPDVIRWATPRFVKYGVVKRRSGDSMLVQFTDEVNPRAIPQARWYYVQGKLNPEAEEHMVVISALPERIVEAARAIPQAEYAQDLWISVAAACEMMKMDAKQLRRYIRRGVVVAHKKDGQWVINRERLRDAASKFGWI